MTILCSLIKGVGGYLPSHIVTNDDLAQTLETSHEWIETRTGICQRHVVEEGQPTSDLAYQAALVALDHAQIRASDIDIIILATSTPDHAFPPTAMAIQARLKAHQAVGFDINVACSGFLFALNVADALLKQRGKGKALVIGAETMSRLMDWTDRSTAVLFGDGAGAVVLSAEPCESSQGLLDFYLGADGSGYEYLYARDFLRGQGILMQGREVFRQAVSQMSKATRQLTTKSGVSLEDITWIVAHQANKRILEAVAQDLDVSFSKFIYTGAHHANTSSASIPLALWEGYKQGRIKAGDLVVIQAFGAGFTWGSYLVRV